VYFKALRQIDTIFSYPKSKFCVHYSLELLENLKRYMSNWKKLTRNFMRREQTSDGEMAQNTTLDSISFPFGLLNSDGLILACNQKFLRQTGLRSEDSHVADLADLYVTEKGGPDLKDQIAACIERFELTQVEVQDTRNKNPHMLILTPDLKKAQCSVQIVPASMTSGSDTNALGQRAGATAAAPSKQTIDFLSGLNHHLRTPVNGVLGIADLLAETTLSAQQASYVDILSRSCNALIHLVDEIQSITLLEQGVLAVDRDTVDIKNLAQETLDLFAVTGEQKEIISKVSFDDSVPGALVIDDKKLRQILFILLDNAFRYTDQGTIGISFSYDSSTAYPTMQITVKDTGIGIANDRLPSLFSEQLDSTVGLVDKNYGNTGLGLILCHKLVTLMGGTISVDSKFGHGACFTVTIPVTEAMQLDAEMQKADTAETSAVGPTSNNTEVSWNILVAEDNPVNQMLFRTVLERFGHRVTVVGNGQEAVAAVQLNQRFDVILMDISMPVMDGIDATAMIRSLFGDVGNTPILALTAHAMDGDREKFINAGMDGYQSKPVDPMTLQKAIAEVIANHGETVSATQRYESSSLKAPKQSEPPESGLKN